MRLLTLVIVVVCVVPTITDRSDDDQRHLVDISLDFGLKLYKLLARYDLRNICFSPYTYVIRFCFCLKEWRVNIMCDFALTSLIYFHHFPSCFIMPMHSFDTNYTITYCVSCQMYKVEKHICLYSFDPERKQLISLTTFGAGIACRSTLLRAIMIGLYRDVWIAAIA